MKKLFFTNHSLERCQQRGISADVAEFIFNYGDRKKTHQDDRYMITKNCIKKNIHSDEFFNRFLKKNDKSIQGTAIIVRRESLITVMKVTKSIKENTSSLRRHRQMRSLFSEAV